MTLAAGTRLGQYEVVSPLGSGGMGEVYCARDTRLGRDVAIKVLPAERLADAGRRARFEREARAVAALSHPHIVTIHEIESEGDVDFIVMELVQGDTLAQRLRRGPLPTGEALRVAIPLADALAAAHAAGVVHRDLKPANVMIGRDGVVKVLDFGLAKLAQDDTAGSEVQTETAGEPLSRPGTVAGTAGYMAPEQASGGDVDARSDVFSFGVLLYEMVTGRRAFPGNSSTEAIAAVLRDQPKPPSELAPDVPRDLERIILRCLRKEPSRRFQHMADVKVELQEVKDESDSQASVTAGAATARRRSRWIDWAVAGLLILATAVAATLWRRRRPELPPPTVVQLTSERYASGGSFSPDGTQIAFSSAGEDGANVDIWLKIVGEAEARRLTTDPAAEMAPAWSPDGTQIAFLRIAGVTGRQRLAVTSRGSATIHLVSPLGGPSRKLSDFPVGSGLSWSPDGRWLATSKGRSGTDPAGIHLILVASGEPRAVTFPKPPAFDVDPSFSPDGRTLAYAACAGPEASAPACDVNVLSLDADLRPRGAPRPLTRQGLWMNGLAWTREGRSIVYGGGYLWRVRVEGNAAPERLELAGPGAGGASTARGRDRLAFVRQKWEPDVYRLELGASPRPLIESTFSDMHPQYSPDGRRVAFQSGRAGGVEEIWLADADGTNPSRLTRGPGRAQGSPRWSSDGRSIAFDSVAGNGHADVWTIGVDGSGLRQITSDPADDILPSWSRDGRFIYFASTRTDRQEIWRAPATGGTEEQLTREGGTAPFESLDGRTLYFMRKVTGALLARPTAGGQERTIVGCVDGWNYAVAPRGLFYFDCSTQDGITASQWILRYRDAATGQDRPAATLEADWIGGLSASPDRRSLVYGRTVWTSELMMIENFR